jgi:hypothetical protein
MSKSQNPSFQRDYAAVLIRLCIGPKKLDEIQFGFMRPKANFERLQSVKLNGGQQSEAGIAASLRQSPARVAM